VGGTVSLIFKLLAVGADETFVKEPFKEDIERAEGAVTLGLLLCAGFTLF